jgi:hypothetical protein
VSDAGSASVLLGSLVAGGAVLAAWVHVRLGARSARGGRALLAHLAAAYLALALAPSALDAVAFDGATGPREAAALLTLLLPALVYVSLVSLWLLAYLRDAVGGGARG